MMSYAISRLFRYLLIHMYINMLPTQSRPMKNLIGSQDPTRPTPQSNMNVTHINIP